MKGTLGKAPMALYCNVCRKKIIKNDIVTSVTVQPFRYTGIVCQKINSKHLELQYATVCTECAYKIRDYLTSAVLQPEIPSETPEATDILPELSEDILREAESLSE